MMGTGNWLAPMLPANRTSAGNSQSNANDPEPTRACGSSIRSEYFHPIAARTRGLRYRSQPCYSSGHDQALPNVNRTWWGCRCPRALVGSQHSVHFAPRAAAARRWSRTGTYWRLSLIPHTRLARRCVPRAGPRRLWSRRLIGCFTPCAALVRSVIPIRVGDAFPGTRRWTRQPRQCGELHPRVVPRLSLSPSPPVPALQYPTRSPGSIG